MNKNQRIVVAGVLIHQNHALIVRRSPNEAILPGLWELPSGKVEFGEHPSVALQREFQEETGLFVQVLIPYDAFDYTVERGDTIRHTVQINYLVQPAAGLDVTLSQEHSEYQWLDLQTLSYAPIDDVLRKILSLGWVLAHKLED